jgi:hypothetical protein
MRRFTAPLFAFFAGCAGSIADSENRIQSAAGDITSMKEACIHKKQADCAMYTPAVSTQFNEPMIGAIGGQRDRLRGDAALIEEQRNCLQRHQSDPSLVACNG